MLRILYIVASLGIGGAERQLFELSTRLDPERFSAEVVAFRDGALRDGFLAKDVDTTIIAKRSRFDFSLLPRLRHFIESGDFDVVHSFMFTANTWGRVAAGRRSKPVLIAAERGISTVRRPLQWNIDRFLARRTAAIVANSPAVARHLIDDKRLPETLVRVIPNGVDIAAHQWIAEGRLSKGGASAIDAGPNILCVGRIDAIKGHDVLIDAFAKVVVDFPQARLAIVGDADTAAEHVLKSRLMEQIQGLGLGGRVSLEGFHSDTRPFLRRADLLVMSSRMEGFPNAILEAMAAGVPVVSTAVGGSADIIVSEESAVTVPPDNSRLLSESIIRVLTDEPLRLHLVRGGMTRVKEFSMDKMVSSYEHLYQELCEPDPNGASGADVRG